ncbi:MAG: hypothetical protein N2037_04715 [Acidimicrobiales bacterium]|nr:hypothetical protein [Acidimicrobiales bacterium]
MDDGPVQPVASRTDTGMTSGSCASDRRVPLWARIVGFVAVLVVATGLTAVVIRRDHDRRSPEEVGGTTVSTASVPPPRPLITGSTTGTTAPPRAPVAPPDENFVATELERVVARDSGWTHAISCWPAGPVRRDTVLQCDAHTEPPIDFVPPSTVIVTVLDDDGRFIWARGRTGHVTLDGLRSAPDLDCQLLRAHEYPYAAAVAYWVLRDRPAFIDVDTSGRPCVDTYGQETVDVVFAAALPYVPGAQGVP